MTHTNTNRRAIAILHLPRTVPALLAYATAIVRAMADNPTFPAPAPRLVDVSKCIDRLRAAHSPARVPGASAQWERFHAELVAALDQLRAYVQVIAARNPSRARTIILSSGLSLRKAPVRSAAGFRARQGAEGGSIVLTAPAAARRASYEWAYSLDERDTWLDAPPTLQARTCLRGFRPMSVVRFRYRPVTRAGLGEWSGVIAILVP